MAYLDVLDRAWPPEKPEPITFVVIPEYVARHWWERILYNQSARQLRATLLLGRPHTVVVDVPYRRDEPASSHSRRSDDPRHGASDDDRGPRAAIRPGGPREPGGIVTRRGDAVGRHP